MIKKLNKDDLIPFLEEYTQDSYEMKWILQNESTGEIWSEFFDPINLNDFEVLYGNNLFKIIQIEMRLKDD